MVDVVQLLLFERSVCCKFGGANLGSSVFLRPQVVTSCIIVASLYCIIVARICSCAPRLYFCLIVDFMCVLMFWVIAWASRRLSRASICATQSDFWLSKSVLGHFRGGRKIKPS